MSVCVYHYLLLAIIEIKMIQSSIWSGHCKYLPGPPESRGANYINRGLSEITSSPERETRSLKGGSMSHSVMF